ncbi:MAG TPA: hypothetical protein VHF89_09235 [Solirubrobacteraceae bacterium]|nr:hypothetical protein [Solirubrobacteraceae bacterium]
MVRRGLATALVLATAGCGGGGADAPTLRAAAARDCPRDLLPLGRNPIAPATRAALRGFDARDRPQVVGAAIADREFDRAGQVGQSCGPRVAARSVVVALHLRAFDHGPNRSASLAQRTVVVGRFRTGWRVWEVLH